MKKRSFKFHNEIILRFAEGRLHEVIIDGIRQNDVQSFAITADSVSTASYLMEHSTIYSDPEKVTDNFSGKLGEDID